MCIPTADWKSSARRAPHRLLVRHRSLVRLRQRPQEFHRVVSSARAHPRNPQALLAPHARPARRVPCPALGHPLHSSRDPVAQVLLDVPPSHNWPRNPARMCHHLPLLLPGDPHTRSSSKRTPQQPSPCCSQNGLLHVEGSPGIPGSSDSGPARGPNSSLSGSSLSQTLPGSQKLLPSIPENPPFQFRILPVGPGKAPQPSSSWPTPGALLTLLQYFPAQLILLLPNLPATEPPNSSQPNPQSS